jgi:hypothetical protein
MLLHFRNASAASVIVGSDKNARKLWIDRDSTTWKKQVWIRDRSLITGEGGLVEQKLDAKILLAPPWG